MASNSLLHHLQLQLRTLVLERIAFIYSIMHMLCNTLVTILLFSFHTSLLLPPDWQSVDTCPYHHSKTGRHHHLLLHPEERAALLQTWQLFSKSRNASVTDVPRWQLHQSAHVPTLLYNRPTAWLAEAHLAVPKQCTACAFDELVAMSHQEQ